MSAVACMGGKDRRMERRMGESVYVYVRLNISVCTCTCNTYVSAEKFSYISYTSFHPAHLRALQRLREGKICVCVCIYIYVYTYARDVCVYSFNRSMYTYVHIHSSSYTFESIVYRYAFVGHKKVTGLRLQAPGSSFISGLGLYIEFRVRGLRR